MVPGVLGLGCLAGGFIVGLAAIVTDLFGDCGIWQSFSSGRHQHVLVGGLEHVFFPYIGNNHPNWRTHIFQRGRFQPPTSQHVGNVHPG